MFFDHHHKPLSSFKDSLKLIELLGSPWAGDCYLAGVLIEMHVIGMRQRRRQTAISTRLCERWIILLIVKGRLIVIKDFRELVLFGASIIRIEAFIATRLPPRAIACCFLSSASFMLMVYVRLPSRTRINPCEASRTRSSSERV